MGLHINWSNLFGHNHISVNSLSGLTGGLTKGLQTEGEALRLFVTALEKGDTKLLGELADIAKLQLVEGFDEFGKLKSDVIGQLITGADPFAGSRHAFEKLVNDRLVEKMRSAEAKAPAGKEADAAIAAADEPVPLPASVKPAKAGK